MGHFYVIIFVLLLNGIIWVFKQLQKQKALKTVRDAEQRRQNEMIRTGRPIPFPTKPNKPATETLAERQERLRQLRQDAALPPPPTAAAAQPQPVPQAGGGGGRPITRELWPGGPVVVIGQAGAPAMPTRTGPTARPFPAVRPTPAPQQQPRPQPQPVPVQRLAQKQKTKKPRPVSPAAPAEITALSRTVRQVAPIAERYRMGQGIGINQSTDPNWNATALLPRTADDWRRAFIASELFRPPVAFRTQEPGQLHV